MGLRDNNFIIPTTNRTEKYIYKLDMESLLSAVSAKLCRIHEEDMKKSDINRLSPLPTRHTLTGG